MLNLLSLVAASPERQLAAAKQSLAHLAEHLNARFSVRLWDGSVRPFQIWDLGLFGHWCLVIGAWSLVICRLADCKRAFQ